MIDAHCHLMDFKALDIAGWKRSGLEAIVNCGYDLQSSISALELKKIEPEFTYCVVGVSPQKCMGPAGEALVGGVEELARGNARLVDGIGEIGLDFHWADTPEKRGWQRKLFKRQIRLAEELGKPIVVHARDATYECIKELDGFKGNVQFHFYSGNEEEAKLIARKGWLISIPPLKGKARGRTISAVPIECLTAETDGPYVGKTPIEAKAAIGIISEAKGVDAAQVEKITSENVRKFFGVAAEDG
ncbi:MAG: TatD family hydrolase [Candidatus Micrarchaeota archaeon]|nr:TatD family hydrolase [Candidatus Micrarchaeota archaeon]